METVAMLSQSFPPRNWHRKKWRVQARVIETLDEVTSRRKNDPWFFSRNGGP